MTIYTYSEARQKFAEVLNNAEKEGKVIVKRRDGSIFEIKPVKIKTKKSPLDVDGVDVQLNLNDILDAIEEGKSCF